MNFRRLLWLVTVSVLAIGALNVVPKYASEYCASPKFAGSRPCMAFETVLQKSEFLVAKAEAWGSQAHDYLEDKDWARKAKAYGEAAKNRLVQAELDKRAKTAFDRSFVWVQSELKPRVVMHSRHFYTSLHQHAFVAWQKSTEFVSTKALPLVKEHSAQLKSHAIDLLWRIWHRIEASNVYQDVAAPQMKKIYDTILLKQDIGKQDVNKEAVSSSSAAPPAYSSIESTSSSTSSSSSSSAKSIPVSSSSSPSSSLASSSTVKIATAPNVRPNDDHSIESLAYATPSPNPETDTEETQDGDSGVWLKRVQRTVEQAKEHLEEDAQDALTAAVNSARPDIMDLLRDIAKFGEKAVRDMTGKVELVESRSKESLKIKSKDVFPQYDEDIEKLTSLARLVRDRVLVLANETLAVLDPVRIVTLDAIDDYFDVVLSEAARELTGSDEWDGWKEYHHLKQEIKQYRADIESHEFNMEVVNNALQESQAASVMLAQEYAQQLNNLRARCQLVFQERSSPVDKEKPVQKESSPKSAASVVDEVVDEEPASAADGEVNDAESDVDSDDSVVVDAATDSDGEYFDAIVVEAATDDEYFDAVVVEAATDGEYFDAVVIEAATDEELEDTVVVEAVTESESPIADPVSEPAVADEFSQQVTTVSVIVSETISVIDFPTQDVYLEEEQVVIP